MTHQFFEHYALLGLKPGAEWRDLKTAYRVQIRKCHPDRFHADPAARLHAEEQTKAINRAYHELTAYYRLHSALPLSATEKISTPLPGVPVSSNASPDLSPVPLTQTWHRYAARAPYWSLFLGLGVLAFLIAKMMAPTDEPVRPHSITSAPASSNAIESPTPPTNHWYFTYGSSMSEVYVAQGIPSSTEPDIWYYGTSKIHFRNGAVSHWEETRDHPLKTRAETESTSLRRLTVFSRGSTKDEVRSIQGNPHREGDKMWDYGVSRIYFERDRVVDWYESPLDPLKVKR